MAEPDTIPCPLCELPHLAAASRCDDCGQPLHEPVDVGALHREAHHLQQTVWIAAGLASVGIVTSFLLVSVVGGAVLVMAPFSWGFSAWWRLRIVKARLARLAPPSNTVRPP